MITVFGLGFVGLTTALGFAHYGYKVYGIDINKERKAMLRDNQLPFLEPTMDQILEKENNVHFFITEDIEKAIRESEFVFYCVGTPYGENGEADLKFLYQALDSTIPYINEGKKKILITKSTIPPSTTKERIIPYLEEKGIHINQDVFVANNPEFLREGYCWEDFIKGDRIVVGCDNQEIGERIKTLYEPFHIPVFSVSYNSGEFIKYLSNTMLATMISYANEMSLIADQIGNIDIAKAFKVLHGDKRWGNGNMSSYVYPGCGYGGYCLPKDTNALYAISKRKGYDPKILRNVIQLNDNMVSIIADKIIMNVKHNQKIGILGLSFKPGSNDVRESVSAKVIQQLLERGYQHVLAYDPEAMEEFQDYYGYSLDYKDSLKEICEQADILVILTGWKEFLDVKALTDKRVLDYRYIL